VTDPTGAAEDGPPPAETEPGGGPTAPTEEATAAGPGRPTRTTLACWALVALVTAHACWGTVRNDYRDSTLVGDQASQLLQAVSLARGGNLGYDATDLRHYADATWRVHYRQPVGLLFQRDGSGWAAAKPYGYSALVAPFLAALGPTRGVAVANTLLLLAVLSVAIALLRLRLAGPAVPLAAAALVFASDVVPYAYVLYVELFTALVVGLAAYGFLRALRDRTRWPMLLGFAALGLAVAEKGPLLVAIGPLAVVALWGQAGWRARLAPVALGAVVFGLAIVPYLSTSHGASYTPYGGQRYATASGAVPFSDPPAGPDRYQRVHTDDTVTVHFVITQLGHDWPDKLRSAATYVVGRHTGLLVFVPLAVVVIGLALARGRGLDPGAVALLVGLAAYAAFYVVLFSDNYYGGGQSFGNRYFVQICPLVAALAAAARLDPRRLVVGSLGAIVVGTVLLWPNLVHPSDAVARIDRTSALQRIFPFEANQAGAIRFACGVTTPVAPRTACEARYKSHHPRP